MHIYIFDHIPHIAPFFTHIPCSSKLSKLLYCTLRYRTSDCKGTGRELNNDRSQRSDMQQQVLMFGVNDWANVNHKTSTDSHRPLGEASLIPSRITPRAT